MPRKRAASASSDSRGSLHGGRNEPSGSPVQGQPRNRARANTQDSLGPDIKPEEDSAHSALRPVSPGPAPIEEAAPARASNAKQGRSSIQSLILKGYDDSISQDIALEREWLRKHRQPVSAEDDGLHEVLGPSPPILDEVWTADMENLLQKLWKRTLKAEVFAALCPEENGALLGLWKLCIRLYRCSPFAILFPLKGLGRDSRGSETIKVGHRSRTNPVWPSDFCDYFGQILSHSMWSPEKDVEKIVLILQYAVICRYDDRRPWDMPLSTDSLVLALLQSDVRQGPLPLSVHEMHRQRRESSPLQPSHESDLLFWIGECVTAKRRPAPKPISYPRFGVATTDLRPVMEAINTYSGRGFPCLAKSGAANLALQDAHDGWDVPSESTLVAYHSRAWLHEIRQLKREFLVDLLGLGTIDSTLSGDVIVEAWRHRDSHGSVVPAAGIDSAIDTSVNQDREDDTGMAFASNTSSHGEAAMRGTTQ